MQFCGGIKMKMFQGEKVMMEIFHLLKNSYL